MTGENEKPVSPLPWRLEPGESKVPEIESAKGDRVTGLCNSAGDYDVSLSDRDYIVTACNAYPDLKARLVALETENRRLRENLTDELHVAQRVFCETMQTLRVVEGPDDRLARKFRMHWQGIREAMEQWDRETMTSPMTKRAFRRDEPDDPYPIIAALQAKLEEWQERARRAEAALESK